MRIHGVKCAQCLRPRDRSPVSSRASCLLSKLAGDCEPSHCCPLAGHLLGLCFSALSLSMGQGDKRVQRRNSEL